MNNRAMARPAIRLGAMAIACVVFQAAHVLSARAEGETVKEIFEKHDLIGIFAPDCGKPPSRENYYYVHRVTDAGLIQRDVMESATTRTFVVIIDKAKVLRPDAISVSGKRDDKPFASVYLTRPGGMRVHASVVDGRVEIANGRFGGGDELPWRSKCP